MTDSEKKQADKFKDAFYEGITDDNLHYYANLIHIPYEKYYKSDLSQEEIDKAKTDGFMHVGSKVKLQSKEYYEYLLKHLAQAFYDRGMLLDPYFKVVDTLLFMFIKMK
jgi:hypothetical protein